MIFVSSTVLIFVMIKTNLLKGQTYNEQNIFGVFTPT